MKLLCLTLRVASELSVLARVPPEPRTYTFYFVSIIHAYGIEVVLLFNGVEDLKGFKVKQLVPRWSLEELKGFQLCYGSIVLRIERSSSPRSHTPRESLEELKGFNCAMYKGICTSMYTNHLKMSPNSEQNSEFRTKQRHDMPDDNETLAALVKRLTPKKKLESMNKISSQKNKAVGILNKLK
ncbi:hypothetical protein M9H77_03472 [Catharanthus roseus]|uniref:Uncharacterized protein n=1 Tax=Catharanthus roseus TaxID=4058 RepID=A0ACC0CBT9_CATRO|nr:hypothetical protein M9H77_03472 [Catharanthus roseus]